MEELVLMEISVTEVLEKVKELRDAGLVQGIDFDFRYCPPKQNDFSGSILEPKHCVFYFREGKYSVFYQLKWL